MLTELNTIFFQNCAKDRMTDFNISVAVKYRRDKYYVFNVNVNAKKAVYHLILFI